MIRSIVSDNLTFSYPCRLLEIKKLNLLFKVETALVYYFMDIIAVDNYRIEVNTMHSHRVVCPVCSNDNLILKYLATYEYSYQIDANAPGSNNTLELLPYMYDTREQKDAKQYIECQSCKASYPCYFDKWTEGITAQMIQEAIDSAYEK